ncbi:MAG: CHAT domain-containing protein [Novosphingobium sp.]|uniref:CHAT domain-containing tetratricopeptide repeat protein n=1 Tax=Novosphingobium sp. TaxID=1874826 RepID=UPI003B9D12AA
MPRLIWAALLAAAVPCAAVAAPAGNLTAELRAVKTLDIAARPAEALQRIDALLAKVQSGGRVDPADLLAVQLARADALYWLDRYDEALPILQNAEARLASGTGAQSIEHARILDAIGSTLGGMGRNDEAETWLQRALLMADKVAGRKSIAYASALYGLGLIDYQRGNPLAALPRFAEAWETATALSESLSGSDVILPADFGISYSALLGATGDIEGAVKPARSALVWAETRLGGDHPVTLAALNRLGTIYNDNGLFAQSIPILRRTLDQRAKTLNPDDPQLGFTIEALGYALDNSGRRDEALPFYQRGAEIFEKSIVPGQPALVTTAIGQLARVTRWSGDIAGALAFREKAVRLGRERASSPDHPDVLFAELNLAREYILLGRFSDAVPLLDHVNANYAARTLESSPRRIGGMVSSAQVAAATGNPVQALASATAALTPARARLLDRATPRAELSRLAQQYQVLFIQQAELAAKAGDMAQAFEALQFANLGDLQTAISSMALLNSAKSPDAIEALRAYQQLAAEGARLRRSLAASVAAQKSEAVERLNHDIISVDARLRDQDALLASILPGYKAQTAVELSSLHSVQAALAPGQAIVLYGLAEDGLLVMAVTAQKAVTARSPITPRALLDLEKRMRGSIDQGLLNNGQGAFDRKAAYDLYLALFPKAVRDAVKSSADLRILATGSLAALPFSAMVTQLPKGADDAPEALKRTRWLALDHAVSVPLSVMPSPVKPSNRADQTFAGIGAPVLGQPLRLATRSAKLLRSGDTSIQALRELASLPGAADELRNMASAFPGKPALLIGADATETAVKAAKLDQASVIAFATHGLVGGAFRDLVEPALVLTPPDKPDEQDDGLLTASEIAKLRLDADWVILSACDTSAGDGESAPTFSGLARSFVAAGARSLLLSHWPVRDDVASRLTLDTLNGAGKGLSRAEALRRAQVAIIRDAKVPGAAHPATWAPFVLVGN